MKTSARAPQTVTLSRTELMTIRRLIRYVATTDPEIQDLAIQYDNAIERALNRSATTTQ